MSCSDLCLPPDMRVAIVASLLQEIQRLGDQPLAAPALGVGAEATVRSEKEALEWSPLLSTDSRVGDSHELFKSADRRDRYRKRLKV